MDQTKTVHECLFCSQTFNSAVDKDDHILEHFAHETCIECKQNLIRIGSNLYTLHNAVTCVNASDLQSKHHVKSEPTVVDQIESQMNLNFTSNDAEENCHTNSVKHGLINSASQNHLEIKIKEEEEQSIANELGVITEDEIKEFESFQIDYIQNDGDLSEILMQDEFCDEKTEPIETCSQSRTACDICEKTIHKSFIRQHKIRMHNFCPVCAQIYPTKQDLDVHMPICKIQYQTTKHCSICNVTLKDNKGYRKHLWRKHNPNAKKFKCDQCGLVFPENCKLKRHVCKPERLDAVRVFEKEPRIINGRYECDTCGKLLGCRKSLRKHKILKHNVLGDIFCKLCVRVFPNYDELSNHQIECSQRRLNHYKAAYGNYECYICKTKAKTKHQLSIHMKRQHTKTERQFKCDSCDMSFYDKRNLDRHYNCVHLNIRNFVCNICGKTYKQKNQLVRHIFTHSSKQYKCLYEDCKKMFVSPTYRNIHMKLHTKTAKKTDEERIKCDVCGVWLKGKSSFRTHQINRHLNVKNYICNLCGKEYKSQIGLRTHKYVHTGEKPFSCLQDGCDRRFRSTVNRDEHMRVHTGETPFHCTVDGCDQRFKFRVDFRRHNFNAHGICVKKCQCTICGETLPENSMLQKHMQRHTQ